MSEQEFESTIVYKDGGPYQRKGGTFDTLAVHTREELENKLANGWYSHPDEIGAKAVATLSSDAPAPDVKAPESKEAPTRDELKLKATELGIEFAQNVSDKKLRELIEAKLADQPKE